MRHGKGKAICPLKVLVFLSISTRLETRSIPSHDNMRWQPDEQLKRSIGRNLRLLQTRVKNQLSRESAQDDYYMKLMAQPSHLKHKARPQSKSLHTIAGSLLSRNDLTEGSFQKYLRQNVHQNHFPQEQPNADHYSGNHVENDDSNRPTSVASTTEDDAAAAASYSICIVSLCDSYDDRCFAMINNAQNERQLCQIVYDICARQCKRTYPHGVSNEAVRLRYG